MLSISILQTTPFSHIFSLPDIMYFDIQWLREAKPREGEGKSLQKSWNGEFFWMTTPTTSGLFSNAVQNQNYDYNLCHGFEIVISAKAAKFSNCCWGLSDASQNGSCEVSHVLSLWVGSEKGNADHAWNTGNTYITFTRGPLLSP